jgi:hypothetical protein
VSLLPVEGRGVSPSELSAARPISSPCTLQDILGSSSQPNLWGPRGQRKLPLRNLAEAVSGTATSQEGCQCWFELPSAFSKQASCCP